MSAAASLPDANIRSQSYYVARTDFRCQYCGMPTRLLALAVPNNHETLDPDIPAEAGDRNDAVADAWQHANINAFLFYVEHLPDDVQHRLNLLSRSFRLARSKATLSSYWANHCDHCGTLIEDHELHCEFDGAFLPSGETAAALIQLLQIPEPFEAVAAGYAFEPEFFRCMQKA